MAIKAGVLTTLLVDVGDKRVGGRIGEAIHRRDWDGGRFSLSLSLSLSLSRNDGPDSAVTRIRGCVGFSAAVYGKPDIRVG